MLSRAAVLEAALVLVDAKGLAALNLRALATRLGVSAMTPYSHFADKAELLSAMVGHALAPLSDRSAGASGWEEAILGAMHGLHSALEQHPGVVELIMVESHAQGLDDFRQQFITILRGEGLSRTRAADVLRTLTSYILGYTLLSRLRREASHDSFEDGLDMIMESRRRGMTAQRPGCTR
jgi:AcrR family transcriptional regulator